MINAAKHRTDTFVSMVKLVQGKLEESVYGGMEVSLAEVTKNLIQRVNDRLMSLYCCVLGKITDSRTQPFSSRNRK